MPPISVLSFESDQQIERLFDELDSLVAVSDPDQQSELIAKVTETLEGFMGIERELLAQVAPRFVVGCNHHESHPRRHPR
jgi:ABC-type transporter Mla subunit MlaD